MLSNSKNKFKQQVAGLSIEEALRGYIKAATSGDLYLAEFIEREVPLKYRKYFNCGFNLYLAKVSIMNALLVQKALLTINFYIIQTSNEILKENRKIDEKLVKQTMIGIDTQKEYIREIDKMMKDVFDPTMFESFNQLEAFFDHWKEL